MRILLIGSGAREHAIADALKRSSGTIELFAIALTRNPGILRLAEELFVLPALTDIPNILKIAKKTKPDLAVAGPEDPIAAGTSDALAELKIATIAPKKALARIESSKSFTRELLQKYGIKASPKYRVFTNKGIGNWKLEIGNYLEDELQGEYVVKYDGLRGGKGVKVSGEHLQTIEEGVSYATTCIEECGKVVIEEKCEGCEFSLMSFVSGTKVVHMPAVQDHKRAYEGDTGPNTGGMGTYSDRSHSLPFLSKSDLERAKEVNTLVAQALLRECAEPYKGILYGGYMAVREGIRLIECNCRFGDPEALNVLPLLSSDFVAICQGITTGELDDAIVRFEPRATVCKYIVPKGYPENKDQRGEVVEFPSPIPSPNPNVRLFFGDISEDKGGTLHLGGSRTAGIVGIGSMIEEAEHIAESLCKKVKGPVRFRSDIGTTTLIASRTNLMKELRGG